jgi:tetratricopeptide (TPR) repeat protein
VRARLLDSLGRVHHSLGLNEEAQRLLEEALTLRRETFGAKHREVVASLVSLATFLCDNKDCTSAEPLLDEALDLLEQLGEGDGVLAAGVLRAQGAAAKGLGHFEEAEALTGEALRIHRAQLGEGHMETAVTQVEMALVLHSLGELEEAERHYREALEVLQNALGDDHPHTLGVLSNLAVLLRHEGDPAAAEPLMRRVLVAQRKNFGDEHERVATLTNNLGVMLADMGRFEEAEALVREALATRTRLRGEGESSLSLTVVNLGYVLHLAGDLEGALSYYQEAVALALGGRPDHPQLGVASFWCGRLLAETGRDSQAEPHLRRALDIYRQVYGDTDTWSLDAQIALGSSLASQGRNSEAEDLLLEGLKAAEPEGEQHVAALEGLVSLYEC